MDAICFNQSYYADHKPLFDLTSFTSRFSFSLPLYCGLSKIYLLSAHLRMSLFFYLQAGQLRDKEAMLSIEVERLKPFEPRCQELEFKVGDRSMQNCMQLMLLIDNVQHAQFKCV